MLVFAVLHLIYADFNNKNNIVSKQDNSHYCITVMRRINR